MNSRRARGNQMLGCCADKGLWQLHWQGDKRNVKSLGALSATLNSPAYCDGSTQ